ncbi:MAG: PAS domain S-box-containing protein [Psychroserpens sp.]|jgi:PAS domain S-box-containing protein
MTRKSTMRNTIDYKELYNNSPTGSFCSLPDGTIIDVNERFLDMTSYNLEEIIGKKKFTDFLSVGGKIYFETVYLQGLKLNGTLAEINFDFIKKDNIKLPILINSTEIKDTEGRHLFTQSVVFDISQRKKYEQEILIAKRKANDLSDELIYTNKELIRSSELVLNQKLQLEICNNNLENTNRQLSNFSHIASHNLRAPVGNLILLQDVYKESTDSEDKTMLFSKMEVVLGLLNETLNDLVETVKIQGNKDIIHDPINFVCIFNKILAMLGSQILESSAIITSDFSKVPDIEYPKLYMESIMLNLLSNSIRYRSPNRIPEIHFWTEVNTNEIKLMARDNGSGIDLKKSGHRLFGLSNTFHRHPDSKGVGLYMTKTQIEAVGGSITVESEVDRGSTFIITLNKNT